MFKTQNNNDILKFGIGLLITGIVLVFYCISTTTEMRDLSKNADFELIDDNQELSTTDKYYKYLEISEYLNNKLSKNKNLPIKNISCNYVDFAQHNTLELYNLSQKNLASDTDKRSVIAGIVRTYDEVLKNYTTCEKVANYQQEIESILRKIENQENKQQEADRRMMEFMRFNTIKPSEINSEEQPQEETIEELKTDTQEIPNEDTIQE